jgi:hypothetical protein
VSVPSACRRGRTAPTDQPRSATQPNLGEPRAAGSLRTTAGWGLVAVPVSVQLAPGVAHVQGHLAAQDELLSRIAAKIGLDLVPVIDNPELDETADPDPGC